MTRKAYPSDVTDAEWQIIEPLLPEAQSIGRPREVDLREIINGIFYVLGEGCSWRALPHDLPPWQTVYNYFRHWQRLGGAAVVMEAGEATENLVLIWVDQGFSGENFARVIHKLCAAKVDVICRTQPGFEVLP
jgi:hypothetical protein